MSSLRKKQREELEGMGIGAAIGAGIATGVGLTVSGRSRGRVWRTLTGLSVLTTSLGIGAIFVAVTLED